ncbi:MAG: serine/threonine-protein kinase [Anaerolineales bacterium]
MLELSGHLIGGYEIFKRVAQGGMSSIYQALDPETGRVVAFKVLPPALGRDPDFKARFEREINVLRKLEHPNIVPILGFGEEEGIAFIVMPFYERGTVKDRLDSDGIPIEDSVRIIEQVADALDFAHKHGVVHRDVKPSNMLIDDQGNVVLSDFGFAHLPDVSLSLTGSAIIGTPAYMSPEQCRGDPVDGRTDQYSLAIVLYEMVTGRVPFNSETPMAVVVQHLNEPVPYPTDVNPKVSEGIQDVLLKALSKKTDQRYQDIESFNHAYQVQAAKKLDPKRKSMWIQRLGRRMKRMLRKAGIGMRAQTEAIRQRRLIFRFVALILTLGLSLTAAIVYRINQQPLEEILVEVTPVDFPLTVQAISTSLVPVSGTSLSPDEFEAALAGTLTAMAPSPTPGGPTVTPTPTATATQQPGGPYYSPTPWSPAATNTPTDTPGPTPIVVHFAGIQSCDGEVFGNGWQGVAVLLVHDASHGPISGVSASGTWSPSGPGSKFSCVSGSTGPGRCRVSSGKLDAEVTSTTFTFSGLSGSGFTYDASSDHGALICTANPP